MNKITPELFATSWFLTAFAFKIDDLSLLYLLWFDLLQEKDQLMLVYLSIAFLQHFRSEIIEKEDTVIAHAITQLSITTEDDLKAILVLAKQIKEKMPYSTKIRLLHYNVFNLSTIDETIISLEQEYCIVLPTQDILSRLYPGARVCDCIHVRCMWCSRREDDVNMIIIDCRTVKEQQAGTMPKTYLLPKDTYKDKQKVLEYPDHFLELRGTMHFCLMGSSSFKSSSFDIKQGIDQGEDCEVQEMIENLLHAFVIKGFPYLSIADGGFEQCHQFIEYFELDLENHNRKKCRVCHKGRPSYVNAMRNKLKEMKQTFMGRIKDMPEEKKRSRSQDQDKNATDFTVSSMLKNRKTSGYKCRIFDKKTSEESSDKYVVMFNDIVFAYGKACPHERFPVSLSFHSRLDNLLKITSLRERPTVLNFIFGGKDPMSFKFKSTEIARTVIDLMKKYYAEIMGGKINK
jgi:hypothetical protein